MAELVDLEVCEISLVDRPATGRKFRVYKCAPERDGEARALSLLKRLLAGKDSAVSDEAQEHAARQGVEEVRKALRALDEAVKQAVERIERLEQFGPVRQSTVAESSSEGGSRLWKGVL